MNLNLLSDKLPMEDKLNRRMYAKNISERIIKYDMSESLAIGLSGEWGCGKSTLLNWIKEDVEKDESIEIIEFDPWYFSNTDELIVEFFNLLIDALSKENEILKKLRNYMFSFASVKDKFMDMSLKEKKFLNNIVNASSDLLPDNFLGMPIKDISNFIKQYHSDANIIKLKENINEELKKENVRLMIIIDDIDRLSDEETELVFKLVKLVANFDNIIYLLAYDKEVVSEALNRTQNDRGREYLGKIIQIPLEVPKPSTEDLRNIFIKYAYELNPKIEREELMELLDNTLFLFKNIRDIKRFFNILNFNYNYMKNSVNGHDFICIMIIQTFEPDIYEQIYKDKILWAECEIDDMIIKKYRDITKNDSEKIIQFILYLFQIIILEKKDIFEYSRKYKRKNNRNSIINKESLNSYYEFKIGDFLSNFI